MIDTFHIEGGGSRAITFDPKKLTYDEHGIPILTVREIEAVATELLRNYCPGVLHKPKTTPVVEIIQRLHERTGILFAMEDLGWKETSKVLGKVCFRKKTLYLDVCLEHERKAAFRFTATHEIGHWVLHRYNYKNWKFDTQLPNGDGLDDDDRTLCRLEKRTQKDWLEFQANVFAASLVTPREMFVFALIETQQAMGIKRNIGHIYLSDAEYSHRDFEMTVTRLSSVFGVSKESVRVRIKTLQLLELEGKLARSKKLIGSVFLSID
jgi:Zn-dependent peptidase ImmA (M78 family)